MRDETYNNNTFYDFWINSIESKEKRIQRERDEKINKILYGI
jgi:hypothetical protein